MSYDPFDGVLLNDPRPPVSGAVSLMLHLRVARRLARAQGRTAKPSLDGLKARAQACRELLAQGLLPDTLRALERHGLNLGNPRSPHGLATVVAHLEAYLAEVEKGGYLEPDVALWRAVDLELAGKRGFWIERTDADGPMDAGLRDLVPSRLRALACVPKLGGATFSLAAQKGGEASGLFGSPQPLVAWFLDGIEAHGQSLPNELSLAEPEGWGAAPWSPALDGLFEGPLQVADHAERLQRGLVEGPLDLLRHAVEQVGVWLDAGIAPADITLIHPEPQSVAAFLAPLLAEEGVALHVRGGLQPLIVSEAWSPLWTLLQGVQRLDPCAVSAGLRASRRDDLRHWADALALADQSGPLAFENSFMHLRDRAKGHAQGVWQELAALRGTTQAAHRWAERLEALAITLRLPMDPDDFYSPLGLLKEAWGLETWTYADMLLALEAFLEAARSSEIPRAMDGVRLVTPDTILDEWQGARATLILDVSEGAWPARPAENPDLDGDRKASINEALLAWTRSEPTATFPPALQRFWLPRSEHGDQIPRAFQREAYAFNKVLAMTREWLVTLSPAQDEEGRPKAQGPFWIALEGVAPWRPPEALHSRLRWRWEGHDRDARSQARATAAQARVAGEESLATSPAFDRAPGWRTAWLKRQESASPTALEGLARCPFRSLAERVWGLQTFDARSRMSMAVGILMHHLFEEVLRPFVGAEDWPAAFQAGLSLEPGFGGEPILQHLMDVWKAHQDVWLKDLDRHIPQEQWPLAVLRVEALLPNLAAALLRDVCSTAPETAELTLLDPTLAPATKSKKASSTPAASWRRTLVALESTVGPIDLELENGRTLAVSGKVDRIERWTSDSLSFLRVVDYKTSKESYLKAYAEDDAPFASHLQTPLYMLLAEHAYVGERATAILLPLRDDDPKPFAKHLLRLAEAGPDQAWRTKLLANLARFDTRLELGDFPPTPGEHCGQCQLAALCGRPVDVTVEFEGEGD